MSDTYKSEFSSPDGFHFSARNARKARPAGRVRTAFNAELHEDAFDGTAVVLPGLKALSAQARIAGDFWLHRLVEWDDTSGDEFDVEPVDYDAEYAAQEAVDFERDTVAEHAEDNAVSVMADLMGSFNALDFEGWYGFHTFTAR